MDCSKYLHNISGNVDKCSFILETEACHSTGFIGYTQFVYCDVAEHFFWLGILPWALLLAVFFVGLSTAADSFFCPSLAVIVQHLKLSHNIAGVTFLAFGNGAPDIFSSVASIVNDKSSAPGLALGALLGAGIFLSTVIVGSVTLLKPFDVMQRPLLRDLVFYLATVYWVFYILYKGQIRLADSIGFIVLYFIYVTVVGVGRYVRKRMQAKERDINANKEGTPMDGQSINSPYDVPAEEEDTYYKYDLFHGIQGRSNPVIEYVCDSDAYSVADSEAGLTVGFSAKFQCFQEFCSVVRPFTVLQWKKCKWYQRVLLVVKTPVYLLLCLTVPVVDFEKENNGWSKLLTIVHCVTSPVFVLFVTKNITYFIAGAFPVVAVVLFFGLCMAVLVAIFTKTGEPPKYHKCLSYVGFLVAVLWIYSLAREVVNLLTMFGIVLDISQEILGLTVLAWSNSLGDLISDLTVAAQGYPRMAISACFGGPLFNLLIGIGIPFTIMTVKYGSPYNIQLTPVAELLCLILGVSLVSSFIILPASRFRATRPYAVFLLLLYVLFLILAVLTELRIIEPLWSLN